MPGAPWHLRLVAAFFLVLGAIGALDQIMLVSGNEGYIGGRRFGAAQIAYFEHYPVCLLIIWTVAVWSVIAAAVLLVVSQPGGGRSRLAAIRHLLLSIPM